MNTRLKQRRQFIKLASGLLVTPFASLVGGAAVAQSAKPPLRMLTIIDSYGLPVATRNEIWVKSTAGDYPLADDSLGTILSPLQAYRDNMLIASGINLDSLGGESRIHDNMTRHTLTGSRKISGSGASAKILHASLDVHAGEYLNNSFGSATRAFPHLFFTNVSSSEKTTFCYDNEGNQIRSIAGAKNQAETIFTDNTSIDELQFQNQTQQSVFELVREQVQSLRGQLTNANAEMVMDAYQSSVDELAAQLHVSSTNVCGVPGDINSIPETSGGQSTDSSPFIFRNIQQAFACDLTSSLTYHFGGETINQLKHVDLYNEAEHSDTELRSRLTSNMHALSHQVSDVADKAHEVIRIHQSELIANLLDEMSVMPDTDGNTVLDNTVVFWTSAMSSNTHKGENYPYLLIAGKNTNLRGGFHYDCTGSTNNDLLTTIAQGLGLPDDRFGGHGTNGEYVDSLNNGPISRMLSG